MRQIATRRDRDAPELSDDNPDASPEGVAKLLIVRSLNHSPRTRHQLAGMLAKRNVPDDAARAALDRVTEVGLIDDGAYAMQWVAERHTYRGLSRTVLKRELRQRGVSEELIEAALEQVSADDELEAARELAQRRVGKLASLDAGTARRRLTSYLQRRGYSYSVVSVVVADVLTDFDEDFSGV